MNEAVNQKVLATVGCSFLIFLITSTRLRQKIIPKIGIPKRTYIRKYKINDIQ